MMMSATLFLAEVRRDLKRRWSYRFNTVGWYVMWLIMFPMMLVIFDGVVGGYEELQQSESLIGFLVWDLCIMGVLAGTATMIGREAREGTLESVFVSPMSPARLFSIRTAAAFLAQGVETLVLGVLLARMIGLPLTMNVTAFAVLGMIILSVYGLSLFIGGLVLIYKQIDGVTGLIALIAVLFTGALAPLNNLGSLFEIVRWFVPTAWGIDALRKTMLYGATWEVLREDGTWFGLGVQALLFIVVGHLVFHYSFKRAQREGSLGSY